MSITAHMLYKFPMTTIVEMFICFMFTDLWTHMIYICALLSQNLLQTCMHAYIIIHFLIIYLLCINWVLFIYVSRWKTFKHISGTHMQTWMCVLENHEGTMCMMILCSFTHQNWLQWLVESYSDRGGYWKMFIFICILCIFVRICKTPALLLYNRLDYNPT